jgi:hypothetical protein
MSDDLAEKVAAVLPDALHAADDLPDDCSPEDVFRAVAAALVPLIREREAAAWERALLEAADEGAGADHLNTRAKWAGWLRDRAVANPYAGSEGA